jgi:hypothetical protein
MGFNSLECTGERVLQNHEIPTSSEPSIGRDAWRAINISLTHDSKKSKGKFMKLAKREIIEKIPVVD